MPRIPMVTRTLRTVHVNCYVADLKSKQIKEMTFVLPRVLPKRSQLVRAVTKEAESIGMKFCEIINTDIREDLYGMTESEFVKAAKIITKTKE